MIETLNQRLTPAEQNAILSKLDIPFFDDKLEASGLKKISSTQLEIFQVNLGKMCNQTCKHCHVDAGPHRKEAMSQETMEDCLKAIRASGVHTVDITGGAPEMHPHFRWFVEQIRSIGKLTIIVRCNLTIILANKKYYDLPHFFKANNVEVVSSLPFYSASKTDNQRGNGVFAKSIEALKMLNEVGYGLPGSGLTLNLVYNPSGAFLPAPQASLENDFKQKLQQQFGILFNNLFSITNLPVSRFLEYLIDSGNLHTYLHKLVDAFNPISAKNVMCKNTISVGYDGQLYDCDFNQMLELPAGNTPNYVSTVNWQALNNREIKTNNHCYGCTAGAGSSCGGTLA